jgi:hypothetical protein
MPLQVITRFACNDCGIELSLVATLDVHSFPVVLGEFGVRQPPPGWEVHGAVATCPQHSTRIKIADANLAAALSRGN